jgi:hypothetical protein
MLADTDHWANTISAAPVVSVNEAVARLEPGEAAVLMATGRETVLVPVALSVSAAPLKKLDALMLALGAGPVVTVIDDVVAVF